MQELYATGCASVPREKQCPTRLCPGHYCICIYLQVYASICVYGIVYTCICRSSIFCVNSTPAAVAGPVDINAMMGGDDDDAAAAGAAALAATRAAVSARHSSGSQSGLSHMLQCLQALSGMKLPTRGLALDHMHE
jgi:hypothetical protein